MNSQHDRLPIQETKSLRSWIIWFFRGFKTQVFKYRKLASHLLPGQEACFISRLTWYSKSEPDCPYRVISDQHDGLIVHGLIPEEYVEKARLDTYLVEKIIQVIWVIFGGEL